MRPKTGTLSASYKAANGKLLRCTLALTVQNELTNVRITGDFFMHPEDELDTLEDMLSGTSAEEAEVKARLNSFFERDVLVLGANAEDFVTLIMKAIEG